MTDYDFGLSHLADDLVGLLDSLRIPAAVFGGASMGGFVSAAVYDQYPTRVLGLLMADGGTCSPQWIYDRETPAFLAGMDGMTTRGEALLPGITHPTMLPTPLWSLHAIIPRMVFRNLHVPMMILDPQDQRDVFPVTDQNERLAKDHPDLVIHRIYRPGNHNILQATPDWLVRDAIELLDRVRRKP